ncbi:hypothetical protein C8F01DRAFT_43016 [Mycena amicta]|nr:hypothetical protein C8F01DRAFT_43016 [Mycena amicta]
MRAPSWSRLKKIQIHVRHEWHNSTYHLSTFLSLLAALTFLSRSTTIAANTPNPSRRFTKTKFSNLVVENEVACGGWGLQGLGILGGDIAAGGRIWRLPRGGFGLGAEFVWPGTRTVTKLGWCGFRSWYPMDVLLRVLLQAIGDWEWGTGSEDSQSTTTTTKAKADDADHVYKGLHVNVSSSSSTSPSSIQPTGHSQRFRNQTMSRSFQRGW